MTQKEIEKHIPRSAIQKHFGAEPVLTIYQGKGCKMCHHTGYLGRLGVFEVLEVSKEIRKLISEKADADEINKKAQDEGMNTMLDDGLDKVLKGLTTIEEVLRVTKVETL
jgi:type II secretory ATPase GspE/PulE/Tfp pilus assembly ATPase PilB-like protein